MDAFLDLMRDYDKEMTRNARAIVHVWYVWESIQQASEQGLNTYEIKDISPSEQQAIIAAGMDIAQINGKYVISWQR